MKLQEKLPNGVTVNGRFYHMNFDYRNVLRMIESMTRKDLTPEAFVYHALKCVMRHPRGNLRAIYEETKKILFENANTSKNEKVTDFVQDADLIRAAFWQTYNINLWRDKLHWLEFIGLLSGLPEGTRYSDILNIRVRPMPEPNKYNADERARLAKAKAKYAVWMTDEERTDSLEIGLKEMAKGLLMLAGEGGGIDG